MFAIDLTWDFTYTSSAFLCTNSLSNLGQLVGIPGCIGLDFAFPQHRCDCISAIMRALILKSSMFSTACHYYISVPRIRNVLWRVFPPPQLIGRESDGLTAEKQKILHCPLEFFPLETERQYLCKMCRFSHFCLHVGLSCRKIYWEDTAAKNWREYGDSLFPTAKSLCIEDKMFYHAVLLVKDFGILLPLLAAHSKESLRQNKNNNEFSLD